jgi:hypothetical protein
MKWTINEHPQFLDHFLWKPWIFHICVPSRQDGGIMPIFQSKHVAAVPMISLRIHPFRRLKNGSFSSWRKLFPLFILILTFFKLTHFILFISLYSWEVTAQLPSVGQVLTGAASSGFWAAAAGWICSAGQALCGKRGRGDHGPTMGQPPCCLLSAAMVCFVGCADQTDVDCVGLCVSTCFDQNLWTPDLPAIEMQQSVVFDRAMSRLSSKNACNLNAVIVLRLEKFREASKSGAWPCSWHRTHRGFRTLQSNRISLDWLWL